MLKRPWHVRLRFPQLHDPAPRSDCERGGEPVAKQRAAPVPPRVSASDMSPTDSNGDANGMR